jgi:hypothetical protein
MPQVQVRRRAAWRAAAAQLLLPMHPLHAARFHVARPQLQEYIESCGHLCDFYPKYHCELNFIEQYWGAAKLCYRVVGRARTLDAMEQKMLKSLDDIPLEQIQRYVFSFLFFLGLKYLHRFVDRSAHFISAYRQGLSSAQAIWAN